MADTAKLAVTISAETSGLVSGMSDAVIALTDVVNAGNQAGDAITRLSDNLGRDAQSRFVSLADSAQQLGEGITRLSENVGHDAQGGFASLGGAAHETGIELGGVGDAAIHVGNSIGELAVSIAEGLGLFELAHKAVEGLRDAFRAITSEAIHWGEELEDTSLKTGISTAHLQELQFAATATGTSVDGLTRFGAVLSRGLMATGDQAVKLTAALHDIGATRNDLADPYNMIIKLSQAADQFGVSSARFRADLLEIGGRFAFSLIPVLSQFTELRAEAERMGVVLDESMSKALADTSEKFNVLGAVLRVDAERIAVGLTPAMTVLANVLTEGAERLNIWLQTGMHLDTVSRAIGDAVIGAAESLYQMGAALSTLADYVSTAVEGFIYLGRALDVVAAGIAVIRGDTSTAGILLAWAEGVKSVGDATDPVMAKLEALRTQLHEATSGLGLTTIVQEGAEGGPGPVPPPPPDPAAERRAAAAARKAAEDKFHFYQQELQQELAAAGENYNLKLQAAQTFVAQVRTIENLPLKNLQAAYTEEERVYQTYLKEKEKDALASVTNIAAISQSQVVLQKALDAALVSQAESNMKAGVVLFRESKLQELADQQEINNAKLANDIAAENADYAIKTDKLNQTLTIRRASGLQETEEVKNIQGQLEIAANEHQAKLTAIQAAGDATRAANQLAALTATLNEYKTAFDSILGSIGEGLNTAFDGIIKGTESVGSAFRKMGEDMALSVVRSGIMGILTGGAPGTLSGALFGGGVSGALAGLIAPTTAGAGSALAQQMTVQTGLLGTLISQGATGLVHLASMAATGALQLVQLLAHTAYLGIIALASAVKSIPIIGGILQHGGLIPSAAGGMVAGGGVMAILHPREMVLPAALSERVQRAFPKEGEGYGGSSGSPSIHSTFNIQAMDRHGIEKLLKGQRGTFEKMMRNSVGRYYSR